ncbi:hypothetical protein AU195_11270 [Mycobacterium sp. IS-1496]|uniref:hypothetical protein n=1 Tax=Mycobacteriaceae TaxID=1762 RepID=UPI0007415032|nr:MULTISPECIES: hypothetical protein [Mycobacteriaceae]KUI35431.1 hypothetical protein AU195_11270 [Mycobacterium sp. IS-1496]OBF51165.1 hypothetical protein A5778_17700 [Mycolicibacterium monacense]
MKIKTLAATSAMAGALGFAAMGIGTGLAQAEPNGPKPNPPVPGDDVWLPGDPPGHNPFGPPGRVMNAPEAVDGVPNWLNGVPPGHWDDPAYFGIPTTWLPPGIPNLPAPLPVVFNPDATAWGVWVNDGRFIPLPR